jgi:protein TonB
MSAPLPRNGMSLASPAPSKLQPRSAARRQRFTALPACTSRREVALALSAIGALHVIVVVTLVRAGVIETPQAVQIIQAALMQAPAPEEVTPLPEPPKTPHPQRVVKPAPLPPKPAPALTAASTPNEAPVVVAPPPDPKPELPPVSAPPALAAASAPPAHLAPPRFDADYLDNPAPTYPSLARRAGEEGKVMLRVFVEASGKPSKIEVRSSSGSQRLDDAAMAAVRRWKFVPARRGEEYVAAWVLVPISFSLHDA